MNAHRLQLVSKLKTPATQGRWWSFSLRDSGDSWGLICSLMLLCTATLCSGCSRLRLPAIDPNGSRVFLPLPNTTGLAVPDLQGSGQQGIFPTPAFTQPPAPPPCLDGRNGGFCNLFGDKHRLVSKLQKHFEKPGRYGEIQMTPMRVVAPVGGEVVLLAGICGKDGYLVNRQPIEWMLSPDSVGNFIAVGDDRPGKLSSFFLHDPKVEKLGVDFARGRTSNKRQVITRGTPTCNDDIELREGQTWLSISSPSEGTSRITVLAPESEFWDQRRLTATIYWIDAQWTFPEPEIERAGEIVTLNTRVTRAESFVPAEGWDVVYTILDPSIATFSPPRETNQAVVKVDANGMAPINIAALPDQRGTTPVLIEVVKPADPDDHLPRLVLATGQSTVTFSAPGLVLEAFGPNVGSIGEQLTYDAHVGNPGDIGAENVALRMTIPAGARYVTSAPEPSTQTDQYLIWEQGALPAGEQLDVLVTLEALRASEMSVLWQATGEGFPVRERRVLTAVIEPSVEVRFAPKDNITEAEVGEAIEYEIDIVNTGRQTLTDLVLKIESTEGMPELYQGDTKVEQVIPRLEPNERRKLPLTFRVQQTGNQSARLSVLSGETLLAEQATTVRGLEPTPKVPDVDVSIDFPSRTFVGNQPQAAITLRNTGETKLTNIQVELAYDPVLFPRLVDPTNKPRVRLDAARNVLIWNAPDLLPRASTSSADPTLQLLVNSDAQAATPNGQLSVRVVTAENVQAQDSVAFEVITPSNGGSGSGGVMPPEGNAGGGVMPPESGAGNGGGPVSGRLKVLLQDFDDPTVVGEDLRYNLVVTNDKNSEDRNVGLRLRLPEGVNLKSISIDGTPVNRQFASDGALVLEDIRFMRAREEVVIFFVLVPQVPQLMELQAQAFSDAQPDPTTTSETTTVILRGR
ncbi:MAG: hypothetical protein AB8B50_12605 [Pirellulaceae bacterium]